MANKFVRRSDGTTGSIPHDVVVNVGPLQAAGATDQIVFTAGPNTNDVYELVGVAATFGTASSSGTLQVEKCASGTAAGSGTDLLSATISLAGSAATPVFGSLSSTRSDRILVRGNQLALDFGGTVTNLANLYVSIYLKRLQSNNSDR